MPGKDEAEVDRNENTMTMSNSPNRGPLEALTTAAKRLVREVKKERNIPEEETPAETADRLGDLDPIFIGDLERDLGIQKANSIRDKNPNKYPLCRHGSMVDRCGNRATVRAKHGRSGWSYFCDRHAFDPGWCDVLGRHQCGSEWEWVNDEDEGREPPIYPMAWAQEDDE